MCPISRPGQKLIVQEMLLAVGSVIIGRTDKKVYVLTDSLSGEWMCDFLGVADCHSWCVKDTSRGIQRDLIN